MTTLNEMKQRLSEAHLAKVETRAKELIAEEQTLQDLRRAQHLTQERMAELLGIGQDSVSRLEKRSNLLLSTLRSYIAAMGGQLRLIVQFPDRAPVDITSLSGDTEFPAPARRRRRKTDSKQ
jgi:transcriptional regulator with XRE-family HTH domain